MRIQQPQSGPTRVDPTNPLVRGMVLCASVGDASVAGATDIVQATPWLPGSGSAAFVGQAVPGKTNVISGVGSWTWENEASFASLLPADFTLAALVRAPDADLLTGIPILFAGGTVHSGLWIGVFGGEWYMSSGAGGGAPQDGTHDQVVIFVRAGGLDQVVVDGFQGAPVTSSEVFSAGNSVIGNFGPGGSFPFTGGVGFVAAWNRALTATEISGVAANPWQVFASVSRRIWVPTFVPPPPTATYGQFDPDLRLTAWF